MISRQTTSKIVRDDVGILSHPRGYLVEHLSNAEESEYTNAGGELSYIADFHKGLNHNAIGEVVPASYRAMLRALNSGSFEAFEAIPLGLGRKLVNPQAGLAYDLEGPDAQPVTIPPEPRAATLGGGWSRCRL